MKQLTPDMFDALLKQSAAIKPRIKREVRFGASVQTMDKDAWSECEVLPIYDKSKNKGILLLQPYDTLYAAAFESGGIVRDARSGRSKSVICDFCYTWHTGGEAGLVTFYADAHSNNSTAQLSCFDLACSAHVRTSTKASIVSRAQLREHMTDEERIERLRRHLQNFIDKLGLTPLELPQ